MSMRCLDMSLSDKKEVTFGRIIACLSTWMFRQSNCSDGRRKSHCNLIWDVRKFWTVHKIVADARRTAMTANTALATAASTLFLYVH